MSKCCFKYLLFLVFMTLPVLTMGQGQKQKELEEKRQNLINQIQVINRLLFSTKQKTKSVLVALEDLDNRVQVRGNLIRITNQQANLISRKINNNLKKVDQLRDELKTLKDDYAKMIVKSYKNKSVQSRVMFLFSSESFLQAYKRLQYMKQYTAFRKKQGEDIKTKTISLQEINKALIIQKKEKETLVKETKLARKQLEAEKKQQDKLIASLKQNQSKYSKQIRRKEREARKIDKQIEALIRAAIAASNKKSGKKITKSTAIAFVMTAEAKALAANFTSNKGKLPWPVERGIVIKRYGKQRHPRLKNVTTFNSGVEIATQPKAIARAAFKGTVLEIQRLKGAYKAVYIRHGNYITVYNNLAKVYVKKGDKVDTKEELGEVYTNISTGKTVLKFLIYQNTKRLNPAEWIYRM